MQAVKEFVNQKKILTWWELIMKRRQNISKKAFDFGNREYSDLILNESDGGKCTRCNANWKRIDFDNWIAKGFYYRPTCDCFFRCPNCQQELYDEQMKGLLKREDNNIICPDCKWPLIKDGKRYWGKQWDEWFKENRNKPWKIWELKKELGIIQMIKERDQN